MFPKKNSRRGISTVLTTMIILVASVVLGTGVVIYGTSLFQTGAQQEAITTSGVTVWVNATNSSGVAWGAAGVRNSGDKLLSVDQINVRGTIVPFTNWYVDKNQSAVTTENLQAQFISTKTTKSGQMKDSASLSNNSLCTAGETKIRIDFDTSTGSKPMLCLTQASGPTSLSPGERMIVYFRLPNGLLSPVDAGSSTSVSIFAGKAGAPTSSTVGNT